MTKIKTRKKVIATMTILRGTRWSTCKVFSNAGFHDFYQWFQGRGRKAKYTSCTNRNHGAKYFHQPIGLAVLAKVLRERGAKCRIRIVHRETYDALLKCPATSLPGYRPVIVRWGNVQTFSRQPNIYNAPRIRRSIFDPREKVKS